ncbi:hypothetical protein [Kitasatospora aureofaciens]|uniref:hypothetical protein n=1 Tax=Kitasatospora aureofaciens TaxID=1894 RepID=UPI001C43BD3C|nr:hypothetical protein [Kitasatospora aureofaciens]MBV6702246.1 hypothetical protein [Kitasatospora aureofaciens]
MKRPEPDGRSLRAVVDRLGADDPASERPRRAAATTLVAVAALLLGWILVLGATTHGQAEVRNWSTVWIGMDLLQVAGLVATAVLLAGRSRLVALAGAATATLLLLDAWFDVMTAEGGSDWYVALAMALMVELPASFAMTVLARHSLDW